MVTQREAERRAAFGFRCGWGCTVFGLVSGCGWLSRCLRVGCGGAVIGAAVMSGMAIAVVTLPDAIRMWTQPDELGELEVMHEQEA